MNKKHDEARLILHDSLVNGLRDALAAPHDENRKADVMANPMTALDALLAPHLARAQAQADKIHRAAQMAREADDDGDVEPWSAQP
jgi:hypothetical protein